MSMEPLSTENEQAVYHEMNQATDEDPVLQWVTFYLDGEIYGINVMEVQEVLRFSEIVPVPGSPHYILGIINLRGKVVTVIDCRSRFGLKSGEISSETRIMVIEIEDQVIGLLVDAVSDVAYIHQSEIEITPNVSNEENSKFIVGVTHYNDHLIILLDANKIISKEDWAQLGDSLF